MFKITATCNYANSSLKGSKVTLWSGKTKKQAETWLKKLQIELGTGYSNYQIED